MPTSTNRIDRGPTSLDRNRRNWQRMAVMLGSTGTINGGIVIAPNDGLSTGPNGIGVVFGTPTALVGLTPVPGTSTTVMPSDAAPALDQSIAPTWTGDHIWSNSTNPIYLNGGWASSTSSSVAPQLLISPNGLAPTDGWHGTKGTAIGIITPTGVAYAIEIKQKNGSSVITGTVIAAGVYSTSGTVEAVGGFLAGDIASPGQPAYSFLNDSGTGMERNSTAQLLQFRVSAGGVAATLDSTHNLSTGTLTLAPVGSTLVFAGPTSGANASPTFRLLTSTDIPNLSSSQLPSDIAYVDKANVFTQDQKLSTNSLILPATSGGTQGIFFFKTGFGAFSTLVLNMTNTKVLTLQNTAGTVQFIAGATGLTGLVVLEGSGNAGVFTSGVSTDVVEVIFPQNGISVDYTQWWNTGAVAIARITSTAEASFPHYLGQNNGTTTIAAGAGAGTGPTLSLTGTDAAGQISLTSGTLPSASASIFTVSFFKNYLSAPYVVFSPANSAAAALNGLSMVYVTATSTGFSFNSDTSALTGTTTYIWNYHVIG